jgi:hypothetical protein
MAPVMTPGHDELGNRRSQMDTDVRSPEAGIYSRIGPRLFAAIVPSNPAGRKRDRDMFLKRSALVEIAANGHSGLRRQYSTALIVLMCMAGLVLVDRVLECGKPADRARSRDRKKWRCAWRSARGGRR